MSEQAMNLALAGSAALNLLLTLLWLFDRWAMHEMSRMNAYLIKKLKEAGVKLQ